MVYISIKYTEDKELIANPNCPIKVLYNFIKNARMEASAEKIATSQLALESSEIGEISSRGKKSSSNASVGGHGSRQSSYRKNVHVSKGELQNTQIESEAMMAKTSLDMAALTTGSEKTISSKSKSRSEMSQSSTGTETGILDEREFDLCDENGQLQYIYNLQPWVNGYETGIFLDHALYIVVLYDRDENGMISTRKPVLLQNTRAYSELLLKIHRQVSASSKQKLRGDKEKSATSVSSKTEAKRRSDQSLTSSNQ